MWWGFKLVEIDGLLNARLQLCLDRTMEVRVVMNFSSLSLNGSEMDEEEMEMGVVVLGLLGFERGR